MSTRNIDNAAEFLWDSGLLGEINRVVLHPRGLMLSVRVDTDGEQRRVAFDALLRSDDPEGVEFGPASLRDIRSKLEASGMLATLPARERIGYVVQPLPSPPSMDDPPAGEKGVC